MKAPLHSAPTQVQAEASPPYLRFGNTSQAHYGVPMDSCNIHDAYVLFQRPSALSEADHQLFNEILQNVRVNIVDAVERTFKEENKHMTPQLRVFLPGEYTTVQFGRLANETRSYCTAIFIQASYRHSIEVEMPEITSDALTEVIQNLLSEVE